MRLDETQQQAAVVLGGPALVIAGPGSGKTAVITHRLLYLLSRGIPGEHILVITFTRAAAAQMRDRYRRMAAGTAGGNITFGTFHSVFFSVLKRELGLTDSDILSGSPRYRLMQDIISALKLPIEHEQAYIQSCLDRISYIKCRGGDTSVLPPGVTDRAEFLRIWQAYCDELRSRRLIDFDDMINMTIRLFRSRPEALTYWRGIFRYILVDEFQDVNASQYALLQLLMPPGPGRGSNLFVVGDDDQSIYGFRGASPGIMLQFPRDYPDAVRISLSRNYRSTAALVRPALRLIGHNSCRFPKAIRAAADGGTPPFTEIFDSAAQENDFVLREVKRLRGLGIPYSEMAVLYRTSRTGRALCELLQRSGVPFMTDAVLPNIYNHWIGEDLKAYMRIFAGARSRTDFVRIINKPSRYIRRDVFTDELVNMRTLAGAYRSNPRISQNIAVLRRDIEFAGKHSAFSAINYLRKAMGYDNYVREYAAAKGLDWDELMLILDELQEDAASVRSIQDWLELAASMSGVTEPAGDGQTFGDCLHISTMHAAKGLEYEAVFIPDANEGLTPHKLARSDAETEEERRLFYVALTRAKRRLYVLSTARRYNRPAVPSRFIDELKRVGGDGSF